ncbi:hypothetical protein AAES_14374 [Amazona aestiva]|uniref:IQ domain-containing protein K n=1 Tax=Amazona aestiva TaxID=12930 RepID=A0A0Q3XBR1_AMAAE|nr:hypothetical protein AAES_14374 [Amazona aestiva]
MNSNNPKRKDDSFAEFFSIPFVKDWLKDQRPTPLSLLLSEEEASIIIQSFWRGYRVRCDSEVQELRQWQKKLREEKNIVKVVKEFWTKQEAKVDKPHLAMILSGVLCKCSTAEPSLEMKNACPLMKRI